jgi:putative selenium metabolism hydrolase
MIHQSEIWTLAKKYREPLVAFTQSLVQTPSLPGQEGELASLIQAEMVQLGYDAVWQDEVGNVIGTIAGGDGPSLMLNGHMDHVDAGDPAHWRHPPFGGEIHADALWGRGVVDMKGALASMVYAGGMLKKLGVSPPGKRYVVGVVQEEVGGLGTRYLAGRLPVARAIIGEASQNQLRRGHRGRVELVAHFEGRSVHAAMPQLGINPHSSAARFVTGLASMQMAIDPEYGASSVAPTRITSEPKSANVTPASLRLVLDWRNIPSEEPQEIVAELEALLATALEPGCQGRIEIAAKELVTHTGLRMGYPDTFPSFTTSADDPWLAEIQTLLATALGRSVEVGTWRFATDGGHLAAAGATVLGFGPGDETVVHTVQEHLPVENLVESLVGYTAICLRR